MIQELVCGGGIGVRIRAEVSMVLGAVFVSRSYELMTVTETRITVYEGTNCWLSFEEEGFFWETSPVQLLVFHNNLGQWCAST